MVLSRPSDFAERDSGFDEPIQNPRLGGFEWLRWGWRQLTSMRTALLLLLALALAAVPGSLIPQNSSDPNGVIDWQDKHAAFVGVANFLQLFDVFTSAWFSAIYLLLFLSLVGCVLPRAKHHLQALRAAPPRTPVRLSRLPAHRIETAAADPETAVAEASRLLKARRYRVHRYGDSISAERGYLRETGNLVFHLSLVGILIAVYIGGGFAYTGQRILWPGTTFVNHEAAYDNLSKGRFFSDSELQDYSITLNSFAVKYADITGEPLDYTAKVTSRTGQNGPPVAHTIKVNSPLAIGGANVYLLGNGYAPHVTIKNAAGTTITSGTIPFLPKDTNLTSQGVIKVTDGLPGGQQLGFLGFFYPTSVTTTTGVLDSSFPDLINPVLSLNLYEGDLGLDNGQSVNAYSLDISKLTEIAGPNAQAKSIKLTPGKTVELPKGLGSIRFDYVSRFVSLDIHHDPTQLWVLAFAILLVAGLLTSLLVPRRRMWMAITDDTDGALRLEYAALARGDDPGLERAVNEFATAHGRELGSPQFERPKAPAGF